MAQDKIMIVDNEMEMIQLLRLYLAREGYELVWTTDSSKAIMLTKNENPDLILLDVVMPGISGIELCSRIREFSNVPILFVSCKNQDMDKVLGLSMGADDYITKPFSPMELLARVKANLRRKNFDSSSKSASDENTLIFGSLEIDLSSHTVSVSGAPVYLTAKEFELLALLCKYPNRVFPAQQIFEALWDSCGYEDDSRTVSVHISNLRKKLESDASVKECIQTVRGVGYKFRWEQPKKK